MHRCIAGRLSDALFRDCLWKLWLWRQDVGMAGFLTVEYSNCEGTEQLQSIKIEWSFEGL